jgi:hypothetical protein
MTGKVNRRYNTILRIMRDHLNVTLHEIRHSNGSIIRGASFYERNLRDPLLETALAIAESLEVKPDLLLYSFGILPKEDKEIIKSDPFFYMEKIKKMCNNHDNRYGKEDVDLYSLNVTRVSDYIRLNRRKKESVTK